MWLPTPDDVVRIHFELVEMFAEEEDSISPSGVKSHDLLESAVHRPRTGAGGVDKYKTVFEKSAALFHSLTKNHAFHNGNKRTALVTLLTVLHRSDYVFRGFVSDDHLYNMALSVTGGNFPQESHNLSTDDIVEELSLWLKNRAERLSSSISTMKPAEFVDKCVKAGARVKSVDHGRAYLVSTEGGGIRFNKNTNQLSRNVIRSYLKKLGLTQSGAGLTAADFDTGITPERSEIYRYIAVLRRLAKT